MDGSSGTCIYLYNLCLNENGVTELSIDHDDTDDIMDVGINEGMDITSVINVATICVTFWSLLRDQFIVNKIHRELNSVYICFYPN